MFRDDPDKDSKPDPSIITERLEAQCFVTRTDQNLLVDEQASNGRDG